jgi:hypothetical protein
MRRLKLLPQPELMRRLAQQQLNMLRLWRPQLMQRLKLLLQLPAQ